jgi:hypothetical protein
MSNNRFERRSRKEKITAARRGLASPHIKAAKPPDGVSTFHHCRALDIPIHYRQKS